MQIYTVGHLVEWRSKVQTMTSGFEQVDRHGKNVVTLDAFMDFMQGDLSAPQPAPPAEIAEVQDTFSRQDDDEEARKDLDSFALRSSFSRREKDFMVGCMHEWRKAVQVRKRITE